MSRYKLNKKCPKCQKSLSDYNKTGFCNSHRDRTGKNNPFYGKIHSEETVNIIKKKSSINSKKLWKIKEYREKVIKNSSKPRHKNFKKEQSVRIKKWFEDNPEQREIRSKIMKKNWKNGIIIKNGYSCNSSKLEKEFFEEVKKIAPLAKRKQTIRISNDKYLFPDIIIEEWGTIIEFYGDYWHANPSIYESSDIIHHNLTAKKIWEKDLKREKEFENIEIIYSNFLKEYQVIVIWEKDYKNNKENILNELNSKLNYEYSY